MSNCHKAVDPLHIIKLQRKCILIMYLPVLKRTGSLSHSVFSSFFCFALHGDVRHRVYNYRKSHETNGSWANGFFSSYFIYQVMKKKLKRILRFYLLKNGCNANVQRDVSFTLLVLNTNKKKLHFSFQSPTGHLKLV